MGRDDVSRRPVQEADLAVVVHLEAVQAGAAVLRPEVAGLRAEELRALLGVGLGLLGVDGPQLHVHLGVGGGFVRRLVEDRYEDVGAPGHALLAHLMERDQGGGRSWGAPVSSVKFIGPSLGT